MRRAVITNVCGRKILQNIFLATTLAKVANRGSGRVMIAHYRTCYFFKKERRYNYRYRKVSSLESLPESSLV